MSNHHDVIIIGGGVTGLSAGYFLSFDANVPLSSKRRANPHITALGGQRRSISRGMKIQPLQDWQQRVVRFSGNPLMGSRNRRSCMIEAVWRLVVVATSPLSNANSQPGSHFARTSRRLTPARPSSWRRYYDLIGSLVAPMIQRGNPSTYTNCFRDISVVFEHGMVTCGRMRALRVLITRRIGRWPQEKSSPHRYSWTLLAHGHD